MRLDLRIPVASRSLTYVFYSRRRKLWHCFLRQWMITNFIGQKEGGLRVPSSELPSSRKIVKSSSEMSVGMCRCKVWLVIPCRAHKENECAASECSLLCNDFLRLGYQNLIVDPGVRQAYSIKDAMDLYNQDWVSFLELLQKSLKGRKDLHFSRERFKLQKEANEVI